jgi:hypothetical protein
MDFTNDGIANFFSTYSILLGLLPMVVTFVLKLVAIFSPKVPSDKIIELIQGYWPEKK